VQRLGGGPVSRALAAFTAAVPRILRDHEGVTVYAGGDDVLALLPLERALDCAHAIEQAYRCAFGDAPATLSAAVVFARGRTPLGHVLAEAHRLLDDVAKEENGRASLVAGVYRGEVTAVQWVTTWERRSPGGSPRLAAECVQGLAHEMVPERARLSSSLVHDLRRMQGLLCGEASTAPGAFGTLPEGIDMAALVKAEIEHRLAHRDRDDGSKAREVARLASIVDALLGRSRRDENQLEDDGAHHIGRHAGRHIGIDGLVLASFLANGGREDEHQP
jgi:CRISPR-associated protein Cmr2